MSHRVPPPKPRILIYDLETTPILAWIWRPGHNLTISHENLASGQITKIICIAYRWLGEAQTHCLTWDKNQNSEKMIQQFSDLVETADIVVAHNGDKFDMKHLNTARLLAGQPPISWPTSEDTLKAFRRHFAFPSFKLDYLAKTLTGSGKDHMCLQDWLAVLANKPGALKKMVTYCKRDVTKLAEVYAKALPHLTPKASRGLLLFADRFSCPSCGQSASRSLGIRASLARVSQRRRCSACGHCYAVPLTRPSNRPHNP